MFEALIVVAVFLAGIVFERKRKPKSTVSETDPNSLPPVALPPQIETIESIEKQVEINLQPKALHLEVDESSVPDCVLESRTRSQYLKTKYKNRLKTEETVSSQQQTDTVVTKVSEKNKTSQKLILLDESGSVPDCVLESRARSQYLKEKYKKTESLREKEVIPSVEECANESAQGSNPDDRNRTASETVDSIDTAASSSSIPDCVIESRQRSQHLREKYRKLQVKFNGSKDVPFTHKRIANNALTNSTTTSEGKSDRNTANDANTEKSDSADTQENSSTLESSTHKPKTSICLKPELIRDLSHKSAIAILRTELFDLEHYARGRGKIIDVDTRYSTRAIITVVYGDDRYLYDSRKFYTGGPIRKIMAPEKIAEKLLLKMDSDIEKAKAQYKFDPKNRKLRKKTPLKPSDTSEASIERKSQLQREQDNKQLPGKHYNSTRHNVCSSSQHISQIRKPGEQHKFHVGQVKGTVHVRQPPKGREPSEEELASDFWINLEIKRPLKDEWVWAFDTQYGELIAQISGWLFEWYTRNGDKLKNVTYWRPLEEGDMRRKKEEERVSILSNSSVSQKGVTTARTRSTQPVQTRKGFSYYTGSEQSPSGLIRSNYASTVRSKSNKHRVTHCYSCKAPLSSDSNAKCTGCSGLVCRCGACFCQQGNRPGEQWKQSTTPVALPASQHQSSEPVSEVDGSDQANESFDPGPVYFEEGYDYAEQELYDHMSDASPDLGYAEDLNWDER